MLKKTVVVLLFLSPMILCGCNATTGVRIMILNLFKCNRILLLAFLFAIQAVAVSVPLDAQVDTQTVEDLKKLWQSYNPQKEPLKIDVIEEWDDGDTHLELVLYSLGKFEGRAQAGKSIAYTTTTTDLIESGGLKKVHWPEIAAYYGYPKGKKNLPAIIHLHGGGQRAQKDSVKYWVSLGYAAISINWGGKVLEDEYTPNTDWDGLAAGFVGDREQTHHNDQMPGKNTLFAEPHLFNSSWSLIAIAARRAITFLEQQPQVDAEKIGLTGHSMGGRATVLTAIDPRIKAATPSVGGSGYLYDDMWGLPGSGRHMQPEVQRGYDQLIDCRVYWPLIKCPILFLGATNDFNSPTDWVIKGMSTLPESTDSRLALAPHLNHRFTSETFASRVLWFESHLKGDYEFPKTPRSELVLKQSDGVPLFKVWPDIDTELKINKVEIYYSYGRLPQTRFWRTAEAKKVGGYWQAKCPVFYADEPLFAFANITYEISREIPLPRGYSRTINQICLSSDYQAAYPSELEKAGVKATDKPQRLIDDFSKGLQDWYTLSIDNSHHWFYGTRKLIDPAWVGPKNGKLVFEIDNPAEFNTLAVTARLNDWQSFMGRKQDQYIAVIDLDKKGKAEVSLSASDYKNSNGELMGDWDEITELDIQPADKALPDNKNLKHWNGAVPKLYDMRWQGGVYIKRPRSHEYAKQRSVYYGSDEFESEFQKAIRKSVELEKTDAEENGH